MAMHRIALLNPDFSTSFRGYSPKEVDRFLAEIATALSRHGEEKLKLSNRVAELEMRLADFEEKERGFHETLASTRELIEESRNSAQREAQLVLEAARAKADTIVQQANMRLARLLDEISEAAKLKTQIEAQLRVMLEGHLNLLDKRKQEEEQILKAARSLSNKSGFTG